ncbi:hypothetical protein BS47DRAFT_1489755 [Hydnum rufescens UP504]|uniref:Uncharacterized protein n=1 Tax=Hydnum rufescens UP504 TaxID=1448309 RepID=A0A9P6AGW5_9AGAM|nr:hypothetical protein BS47DRAFT_1489755 [Hydnum rufescens UP504]
MKSRHYFAWSPPTLSIDNRRSKAPSTGSRIPAFYDKHFSIKLILKQVRRLPSLAQQLAGNAAKGLEEASETLPSSIGFTTADYRDCGVLQFEPCSSFLVLHPRTPPPAWYSLVDFTQSPGAASEALEDGRLHLTAIRDDASMQAKQEFLVHSLESETRGAFLRLQKADATLMTWEVKSLSAGSRKVMLSVLSIDAFKWTFCTDHDCAANESHCQQRDKIQYAGKMLGRDAECPPWKCEVITPFDHNVGSTSMLPPRYVDGCLSREECSQEVIGKEIDEGNGAMGGRKRKRNGIENGDSAYQDHDDLTAQNVIQQQAVRSDVSLFVIHSGNHELICLRHRHSQTLYVSNLIEPSVCKDPGYGQIQVGIYMAAIQDTIARHMLPLGLLSLRQPPDDEDDDDDDYMDGNNDCGSSGGRTGGRGHRGGRGRRFQR